MSRQSSPRKLIKSRNNSQSQLKQPSDSPPSLRVVQQDQYPKTKISLSDIVKKSLSQKKSLDKSTNDTKQEKKKKIKKEKPVQKMNDQELIEIYLKSYTSQIDNENDQMTDLEIEKSIEFSMQEKEESEQFFQSLEKLRSLTPPINYKYHQIAREQELVQKIINHLKTIIVLFKDKQVMRAQLQNQATLMKQFAERTHRMEIEFMNELQNLKNYNKKLPSEREIKLEVQMKEIKKQLEKEQTLRKIIEEAISQKILGLDSLYSEAHEAKEILIEEIKQLKYEKCKLRKQENLNDFGEELMQRNQEKLQERKVTATLSNFNKSFQRMQSNLNDTKGQINVSKQYQ